MTAELLTVGSELLSGAIVNTNAAYLARRLAELGLACRRCVAVGDDRSALIEALREAAHRSRVILMTGGLGPTFDDITMAAIAEATGRPLRHQPSAAAAIRRFYTRQHRRLQQAALRQALIPDGGVALPNPIGTAPGLWLELPTVLVIALPGVPREMQVIMEQAVIPRLRARIRGPAIESLTLRTVGLVELQIERQLRRITIPPGVEIGLYPHLKAVDVRLTSTGPTPQAARAALRRVERPLRRAVGLHVYGTDEATLESVVGALLVRQRKTLGIAESCTGGLVADQITNVSGSSRYLRGAVVAYHNTVKTGCLGVSPMLLARHGAVSAPVARAMAEGVRRLTRAGVGMAITGIAGPAGGSARKPVGLVFVGLADGRGVSSLRCQFFGDRTSIKMQAAQTALDCLRRHLLGKD